VQLGLLFPNSGVFAPTFAGFRGGVDARFAVENARGGVAGRKLSYIWQDDAGDTGANLIGARQLVDNDHVFAVIEGSAAEPGSAQYLSANRIPVTGLGPSNVWNHYPNMFTWTSLTAENAVSSVWGDVARQHGGTKAAVLAVTFVPGSQQLAEAMADSMRTAGIDVTYQNFDILPNADMNALATAIARTGADVVTGVIPPEIWSALGPALRRAGDVIKVPIFPSGYDQSALRQFGPLIAGTYFGTVTTPFEVDQPIWRTYLDAMANFAPQVQPAQNQLALNGWLAADLLIKGLQLAGPCPTRQTFETSLRAVTNYDGAGLIRPPANLTAYQQPARCLNIVRVAASGQAYEPLGDAPVCGQIRTG
jgi:ABC-type branched-subunit amino acid transport system substrate-binding protein